MSDNNITVIGNLTRLAELRFTPSGQAVATFGLAVNRKWQNRQTQAWEEDTSFLDVVCWAQLAENVAESLEKGTRVIVTGRVQMRTWETAEGDKRSKIEIVADDVGPALKWATCAVTRNERSDNSYTGASKPTEPVYNPPANYAPNEEPF